MQTLTTIVAIVILMSVVMRFAWIIARGTGILTAGWESAGWLTLALLAGMAYASTETEAEDQESFEVTQPVDATATVRGEVAKADESERRPRIEAPRVSEKVVGTDAPAQAVSKTSEQATGPAARSQEGMSRRDILAELHAETVEKFVKSPGFGFERRIRIRIDEFDTPEKNRLYLPRNPLLASSAVTREIPLPDRSHWKNATAERNDLRGLQQIVQRMRKANAPRRKTAETTAKPAPKEIRVVESRPEWDEWEVTDWELVSLLKNDPPVAYSSRNLQMMHRPGQTATRALDQLESGALAKLRKGERLIVANGINAIRMVGAVHAATNCLQCHKDKKAGDLLGAFSYELHRTQPIALAAKIGD